MKTEKSNVSLIFPWYIIWGSSLLIGFLASVPKLIKLDIIDIPETAADFCTAFLFSLSLWYLNKLALPVNFRGNQFRVRIMGSVLFGGITMFFWVWLFSTVFYYYGFNSIIFTYQFRGILINLLILVIIYSLIQDQKARQYNLEVERLKSENLKAQFDSLRQQVNPHFLFNSLNILKNMIETGDPKAAELVMKLADFYRFTLQYKQQGKIRLEEELRIMEAYAYLLKARFEDGLKIKVDVQQGVLSTYTAPFTLQMLLENSIKHNVISLGKPLTFSVYSQNDYLIISNNLQRKRTVELSTATGLENIGQRYHFLTGKDVKVCVSEDDFTVKLPLIHHEDINPGR